MKFLISAIALLIVVISCEFQTAHFDPERQYVSHEERIQIDGWKEYQSERMSTEDYEVNYPEEFVSLESTSRKNSAGEWVIEGSIKNFSSGGHFNDVELTVSFYSASNALISTENYRVNDVLAPGDRSGFYFKTATGSTAHSVKIEVNDVISASR